MCKQIKNHPLHTAGFQEHMLIMLLAAHVQFVLQAVAAGHHCMKIEYENTQMPEFSAASMCDLKI